MIQPISIERIRQLSHSLARQAMEWDEPIPEFDTRFPNKLESCVAVPFQRFNNQDAYPGLIPKAGILFYLLIKNHPFQNGNKRIAVTTLLIFLYLNDKWIDAGTTELYNFAVWVAQSPPELKNTTVLAVEEFIEKHISNFEH
ncbi:hypothetical protein CL632_01665 [bacterium]|jgi:death-on-curing family protein|nr:hypothetical protein [bacterium]MDP6571794.1 type II toxin-antitoxin system death-on-curing family toxin [Patescibacteria group bacterium]MDP6756324.1 type II toxin-antitoxin system death-on-curing family toxin [Patescibacteria group bacterium]|tara:strand:- start:8895 stop:9320 length:426 start_codon:yes stop_codon:yes gene_type:complete